MCGPLEGNLWEKTQCLGDRVSLIPAQVTIDKHSLVHRFVFSQHQLSVVTDNLNVVIDGWGGLGCK